MRILIIEDDRAIATNLYEFLSARGHVVDATDDGLTGLRLAMAQRFDAIVLDLGLPGMDGLTLCHRLRNDAHVDTPILILTARDTLQDKLHGFERGADDYLVKPFALKEAEARLNALHKRRSGQVTMKPLAAGELTLDPRTLDVRFTGKDVKVPPKCLRLLEKLMTEPGRVFTRAELENAVWGDTQETSDTLRTHMHLLRRELVDAGGYDPVETVHGIGYKVLARTRDA